MLPGGGAEGAIEPRLAGEHALRESVPGAQVLGVDQHRRIAPEVDDRSNLRRHRQQLAIAFQPAHPHQRAYESLERGWLRAAMAREIATALGAFPQRSENAEAKRSQ